MFDFIESGDLNAFVAAFDSFDEDSRRMEMKRKNVYGKTLLHVAMDHRNLDIIRALLERGMPLQVPLINEPDTGGNTPLYLVAGAKLNHATFSILPAW